jgi:hypothetical protein
MCNRGIQPLLLALGNNCKYYVVMIREHDKKELCKSTGRFARLARKFFSRDELNYQCLLLQIISIINTVIHNKFILHNILLCYYTMATCRHSIQAQKIVI